MVDRFDGLIKYSYIDEIYSVDLMCEVYTDEELLRLCTAYYCEHSKDMADEDISFELAYLVEAKISKLREDFHQRALYIADLIHNDPELMAVLELSK